MTLFRKCLEVQEGITENAFEDVMRRSRIEAAERMISLNVEDVPDPDTLSRELEKAHEPGGIY